MNLTEENLKAALQSAIENSVYKMEGKKDKTRKFDESLDLVINFRDIDVRNPNMRIDQEFLLPNEIHQGQLNLCFIANGDMVLAAKEKKYDVADENFLDDLNSKDKKTKKQFAKKYDTFVCQAPMMRTIAKVLGRFLGQSGKMPKPQPKGYGVVRPDEDVQKIIENQRRKTQLKMKKSPVLQTIFGKKSIDFDKNFENLQSILNLVESKMPNGMGNIKSVYLKTTMGKSVKVLEDESKKGGRN